MKRRLRPPQLFQKKGTAMCVQKDEATTKVDRLIAAIELLQKTLEKAISQKAIGNGNRT